MRFAPSVFVCFLMTFALEGPLTGAELQGRVVDAETGKLVAARIYVLAPDQHFHVESVGGQAVLYRKARGPKSIEAHTSISADPFRLKAPAGKYELIVERGKEYHAFHKTIELPEAGAEIEVRLKRWIRMRDHHWYSGETHVHRPLDELPTAMLAEEMNVALPLTHWVTRSHTPPTRGNRNLDANSKAELIQVAKDHVIYPLNTEYEIFSVGPRRHTLGAVFALNHREPLAMGAPPVAPIAAEVHRQGGLLELDKHNWPWSMMLPPIMQVDLYELTNNHIWRTQFAFNDFGEAPAEYMNAEKDPRGGVTENGWIQFTLENYYALLNCGFAMKPTAGCASGVHPVPLGFGRVYVHQPDGFDYADWMRGLGDGRTFVTTGPMMDVRFDGRTTEHRKSADAPVQVEVSGWIASPHALDRIEVLRNGKVVRSIDAQPAKTKRDAFRVEIKESLDVAETSWLAVRCYSKRPSGRVRFAHTAPYHVDIAGTKLFPSQEQVRYLLDRVRAQIERNEGVLSAAELAEYRRALAFYEQFSR